MRSKLITQFLGDVDWGKLDYLVADLPPGTGDEIMTITQQMKPDMAIIVTTPQELSLIDSVRAINMAKDIKIPNIALIENMSGLKCPDCGHHINLFGAGGGKNQAKKLGVTFLGTLPINIKNRILADKGKSIILEDKEADISIATMEIVKKIDKILNNEAVDSNA
jgi:ATP-binding protein involved in chromosome partitioning